MGLRLQGVLDQWPVLAGPGLVALPSCVLRGPAQLASFLPGLVASPRPTPACAACAASACLEVAARQRTASAISFVRLGIAEQ